MTTYITHVRLSPPRSNQHEHITDVKWSQPGKTGQCTRAAMVDFINQGNAVYVEGAPNPDIAVRVVHEGPPYLRTVANQRRTDNLISLPRF